MSRTAGLGTQDYVAINVAAVMAILLGFVSALAMVSSLLLIIPVAGVICGIVALYQLSDSNGTQSGRIIAWGGIVLSVLFAGLVGGTVVLENFRTRSDRQAVIAAVDEFGAKLVAADFKGAYETLGPRFRERLPFDEFEGQMTSRYAHPAHGRVTGVRSTGRVMIESDAQTGVRFGTTQLVIDIEHGAPDRPQMTLLHEGGRWIIEGWGWFPPRPAAAQPARAGS